MNTPKLPWSADAAIREMWVEWLGIDVREQPAEIQNFFRKHIQAAYDAGAQANADRIGEHR